MDMKRHINFCLRMVALLPLMTFVSCENDWDKITVHPATAPENMTVDNTNPFVCTAENAENAAFTFSWSKAELGQYIAPNYALQFDIPGNNFAAPAELIVGSNTYETEVMSSQLNSIMHKLGQPVNAPTELEVRVSARPMVIGSATPTLDTLYSASKVTVNVTSYAMAPTHIIGSMFDLVYTGTNNSWNNNNYEYVMFRDNPLAPEIYVSRFLHYNNSVPYGEFALLSQLGTWNLITRDKNVAGVLTTGGKNIQDIVETGYYTFSADMSKMTYSITPYDAANAPVYAGIEMTGAAAGTVALTPAHYDPHIWIVDNIMLTTTDKVKFRATAGNISWGADTFPWGTGVKGGDDISVAPAGKYFIKFNDLTGHYVFFKH